MNHKKLQETPSNVQARSKFQGPRKFFSLVFCHSLVSCCLLVGTSVSAFAQTAYDILAEIPVQHSGRVKPFESFARESVLYLTGKNYFQKKPATELVWQWMAKPEEWGMTPLIPVSYPALRSELGLRVIGGRISPENILRDDVFLKKAEAAVLKRQKKEILSQEEQKRIELYERATHFQEIGTGQIPGWIAHPEDPRASWLPFQSFAEAKGQEALSGHFPQEKLSQISSSLAMLLGSLAAGSEEENRKAAMEFSGALKELFESRGITLDKNILDMELNYIKLRPFGWTWKFYLASALLLIAMILFVGAVPLHPVIQIVPILFFLAGFLMHSYGFYLRCMIAGRPPVTNMYESIVWVSWAAAFFSIILFAVYRAPFIATTSSLVAALALILAEGFPVLLDPTIGPLVPVLRSNLWLTVHVLTITLSYGAFALAWGLGHGIVFNFVLTPQKTERQLELAQYLYRTLQVGVILLAAGTVLGGVWANYSWGRFWGWDPKETWALIALLGYLTVLHGRLMGWLTPFTLAVGSVVAFLGIVMAWYGVNFVLAAGLHSYGFGGGGVFYVGAVALADLALMGWAMIRYRATLHS